MWLAGGLKITGEHWEGVDSYPSSTSSESSEKKRCNLENLLPVSRRIRMQDLSKATRGHLQVLAGCVALPWRKAGGWATARVRGWWGAAGSDHMPICLHIHFALVPPVSWIFSLVLHLCLARLSDCFTNDHFWLGSDDWSLMCWNIHVAFTALETHL